MSSRDIGIIALVIVGVLILVPLLGGMGPMGGWGMRGPGMMAPGTPGMPGGPWSGGPWGRGMHLIGGLFWLVVLAGLVVLIVSTLRHQGPARPIGTHETPLDILKRRLAQGEITLDDYEKLKKEVS